MLNGVALCFIILLGGCAIIQHQPPPAPKEMEPAKRITRVSYPEFSYNKNNAAIKLVPDDLRETEKYLSFNVEMITFSKNRETENITKARYIKSKEPGKKKLVVVLPIYGSSEFPPEMIALNLTEWNAPTDTNVLLVQNKTRIIDWNILGKVETEEGFNKKVNQSVKDTINAVKNIRRLIDWAEAKEEINSKQIGIVGFSIGAIVASIVMGVDERISAGVFVTGGGKLEDIFTDSEAWFIQKARGRVLKRLDWTKEKLRKGLAQKIETIDPLRYVNQIDTHRVLLFEAEFDEYIPHSSRHTFWEALEKPERIIFGHGHKMAYLFSMTILGFHYTDRTITNFFNEKL